MIGSKKLPELSRSIGQALSEFKKGVSGDQAERSELSAPGTLPPPAGVMPSRAAK